MEDLILGIEPAHVFGAVIAIGAAVIGMAIKINRCIGRQEAELRALKDRFDIFANSYLEHLDKKK